MISFTRASELDARFALMSYMSARGTTFFHRWLAENVAHLAGADMISVARAVEKLIRGAEQEGIDISEIVLHNGSVYEAILDAIAHHDAGVAD